MHAVGFEPFINENSEILILGSFPSVKSRENMFYYGNPLNRFFKIIAAINNDALPKTIEEKMALLNKYHIALYDMVIECDVDGSLDTNIKNAKIAKLEPLIESNCIKYVICNGNLSKKLFIKHYPQYLDMAIFLPSTSPANTKLDINLWIETIKNIINK